MEGLTAALTECLKRNRASLNARFQAARAANAAMDGEVLLEHLRDALGPIAEAVAAVYPERTAGVVDALYDVSLEMVAARLVGRGCRYPAIQEAWRSLLPAVPRLVALEPARLAAAVSNAQHNLASTPGARADAWLDRMKQVGPRCPDAATFLDCGMVLAWVCGLAQYRRSAIEVARRAPAGLVATLLGLPPEAPADRLPAALERMAGNPWLTAQAAAGLDDGPPAALRLMGRAGGFRGLGGPFLRPPTVFLDDGRFLVSDGEGVWELLADVFGSVLIRAELPARAALKPQVCNGGKIAGNGEVSWLGRTARIEDLALPASSAADETTLAVTTATSHHVFLLGVAG